jgi:predicted TIM-barrel fold metal-dependent hydrolase
MIDSHIHIGQFNEMYYEPVEIIDIVMKAGIESVSFSSTTSCKDDVLYAEIEHEISALLSNIPWSPEIVRPFFWYTPDYIRQGVDVETAMKDLPYKGIKIHPYAHQWDFDNPKEMNVLHNLFDFAGCNMLPVLIHTGMSGVDSANKFEGFFSEYKQTQCILAHCRPLDETIDMLKKYTNVYCDTAFVSEEVVANIVGAGIGDKIIFGTDFPITHYFSTHNHDDMKELSLKDQYQGDIKRFEF